MAKSDIQILPHVSGEFSFEFIGKEADDPWLLLQRLYVLMLTDQNSEYRHGSPGTSLLSYLEGANRPADPVMNSVLALSCATALRLLDAEDSDRIAAFTATSLDGKITCVLSLKDGTVIKGGL